MTFTSQVKAVKRLFFYCSFILSYSSLAVAQSDNLKNIDLHPVSPTAYQFLKYTEMPVSEYSGIPSISIPIFDINVDGITVPLNLSYHSVGVRVSQEASWVGLGWDLKIGSIVQNINDLDDFGNSTTSSSAGHVKMKPDYAMSGGVPSHYPNRYKYPCLVDGSGYTSTVAINDVQFFHGYKINMDSYVPVKGSFEQQWGIFNSEDYDSEPDIFVANFLGHSIKFIWDWDSNTFVVLNKKGYEITKNANVWKIIVPSGEEFYFDEKSEIKSSAYSTSILGPSTPPVTPSSILWMLTKIVTREKKEIVFNYSRTAEVESFPSYSDKLQVQSNLTETPYSQTLSMCTESYLYGYSTEFSGGSLFQTFVTSSEQYLYLKSIVFPSGRVDFNTSDRTDIVGGKKLDDINISGSKLLKSYKFRYGYFDASNVISNGYNTSNNTATGDKASLRLKLLSLEDNTGAQHKFTYNSVLLPKKNSYAQDFWGFYNGKLSNTSLVPNPTTLKHPELGDNGNDRSANIAFVKAGMLEEIRYPTGGKIIFDFVLNQFDNYWVPDYGTTTNTTSTGNGLRINSITLFDANNVQSKKTIFTYTGGKSILPIQMYRQFPFQKAKLNYNGSKITIFSSTVSEISSNGVYSSSIFSSTTGVGYDKVVRQDVDLNALTTGKVETTFYNRPDEINTGASTFTLFNSLPVVKQHYDPENGLAKIVSFYDSQNKLLKKVENSYKNIWSKLYYGARIFPYDNAYFGVDLGGVSLKQQNLIGCYPIYDFESLLTSTTVSNYVNADISSLATANSYDSHNQLEYTSQVIGGINISKSYAYPYSAYPLTPSLTAMTAANRLTDVINFTENKNGLNTYVINKEFGQVGNKFMLTKTIEKADGSDSNPNVILYDQYDVSGNLQQFHSESGAPKSLLWGYNKLFVIAEINNATLPEIYYESFEEGNSIGIDQSSALSGKKVKPSGFIINFNRPNGKDYILSYWYRTGVTGPWIYKQVPYTFSSFTIADGAFVDEVRIHPSDAQMSTYTYEPLVGVTSVTDVRGSTIYYEYDTYQKLKNIKDRTGNILKSYGYHLGLLTVPNDAQSSLFTKSCPQGTIPSPSSLAYAVPANTYFRDTKENANQKALEDIALNGQNYANNNCICQTVTMVSFGMSNSTASNFKVYFRGGPVNYDFDLNNNTSGTVSVAAGTYSVELVPTGSYITYNMKLWDRPLIQSPRYNFTNVGVSAGSNPTVSIYP